MGFIISILIAHTQSLSRPSILFHALLSAFFPKRFLIGQEFLGYRWRTVHKKNQMAVRETWNRQRSVKEWNFTVVQSVQPGKDGTEVVPFSYSHIYGRIYFCRSCEETLKLEKLKSTTCCSIPFRSGDLSGCFWGILVGGKGRVGRFIK